MKINFFKCLISVVILTLIMSILSSSLVTSFAEIEKISGGGQTIQVTTKYELKN